MAKKFSLLLQWFPLAFCCMTCAAVTADESVPDYNECRLDSIYPAGGQQGSTVQVDFYAPANDGRGNKLGGLANARDVLVDGPPGITVQNVKNLSDTHVTAALEIAKDAVPGRRMLRVLSGRSGLTNFGYFVVGSLPEALESRQNNNEPTTAQEVAAPVVVNGRIDPTLDVDCYRFPVKKGQQIVAAILAHGIDSRSQGRNTRGFTDASIELLDESGRVLADALDTVGLDPIVTYQATADGWLTARVSLVAYLGFPEAVYRLTLGEVSYPLTAFPAGGRRGETVEVELAGHNVLPGMRTQVTIPADEFPMDFVSPFGTSEVRLIRGDEPELLEQEPNDDASEATAVQFPATVNGRFATAGDEDWYRLKLKAGERIRLELFGQRFLRSPIDTRLEVFDPAGELLAANDDAVVTEVEQIHDFDPFDSTLNFTPKKAGEYLVRVTEQTGAFGEQCIYRLTAKLLEPDLVLRQWPDGVPVWGSGSTAGFLVTVERIAHAGDVELRIEGLESGWTGSVGWSAGTTAVPKVLMTITAPANAPVGATTSFQVVGRATVNNAALERQATPLTSYVGTDRQFCRVSPIARAVVAQPRGIWLDTDVRELEVTQGEVVEVPVRVLPSSNEPLSLIANLAGKSFRCNLGVPLKLTPTDGVVRMPIKTESLAPGVHTIIIAKAWPSETRKGMPGPCTPAFLLKVNAK